jgi:hypothetical protein
MLLYADEDMAARIHSALAGLSPGRWCVRVNRPPAAP